MYCGVACHSWISAASNCWKVTGCTAPKRTRLPSSAHKCSIGFKSRLSDGHCKTLTRCWCRKSVESLATCGLALSCWNSRKPCCAMKGTTSGCKMVSRYATALRRPCTTCNGVLWSALTPAHTMIPPTPHRLCSKTQHCANLSPRCR